MKRSRPPKSAIFEAPKAEQIGLAECYLVAEPAIRSAALDGNIARRSLPSGIIWDDTLPGFGLRVRPTGHKAWIVKYRERRQQRFVTLGPSETLEASAARARARALLERAALDGLPPRRQVKVAPSFREYVDEFWRDYAHHWKPSTARSNAGAIRRELTPVFGDLALDAIARADVLRWRADLAERQGVFNRALPVLAVMLVYAEQLGYRRKGSNPCKGTPRYKRELPDRFLSPREYQRLGRVLADAEGEMPLAVAATIGNAAVLSEATARSVACGVLLRCQTGEDPAAKRARVRSAPTYAAFLEDYWRRMSPQWKPRTQETQDSYRRNHLDGAFAGKFIDEIETADVARWFARITDNSGPGAANRCLDILSAAMRRAEEWGYRVEGDNPCAGVRANRRRKCERFLSDQELARLGEALKAAEPIQPVHAAAVKMLILTGCRVSEIVQLRWGELRGQRLLLTDSKTGARTVWLGSRARTVLDAFPRGRPDEFVLPFDNHDRSTVSSFWQRVRLEAGLPGVRLHDLRHSFASFAARQSESLPMIGKLLGHAKIASTARYAHLDDASVLLASERIGTILTSSLLTATSPQRKA